ncbi:kinase-like domain-containing protein [Podospora didyma]|uniref:EKC/KEOPS complex subunit BUD32 n=1 Tax=Podospora didyma TaxID=330526 RepID=A0AAE0K869_9PEZI|nr:kinase-like domain-containing protein [Podospora didyma]
MGPVGLGHPKSCCYKATGLFVGTNTEDVEKYRPGCFHTVHLGDRYGDGGRYKIVHKLGNGGSSTVWPARDRRGKKWVALKIVAAKHSALIGDKEDVQFTFEGPNGHHLCLVLPVLGPSASDLSAGYTCRLRPWLARKVGYEAAKAVADLHSRGLCHGDVTTANILFSLLAFDRLEEADIYNLFGPPAIGQLETESGEITGPEAPRYIVKYTIEFLALEVAAGFPPGPASDVWALGCCLFRLRPGTSPFQVTSPRDLMRDIVQTLGDMPREWQQILWDEDGRPTREPGKGLPLQKWEDERPLKDLIYQIWDEPEEIVPPHVYLSDMVWRPTAVKVDNIYLGGYNIEWRSLLNAMPKIPEHEADLLFDLLSKIFVYDPETRLTAREVLSRPWFQMDS